MARFREKPTEVEAEPYRPGLEDGFNDDGRPVLDTSAGRREVSSGDWIVTKRNGEREIVETRAFERLYEPCPVTDIAHTFERARKGIPMRSG